MAVLWLFFALAGASCAAAAATSYALVADAGSTATRLYLYKLTELGGEKRPELQVTVVGKGPALSSFEDKPREAAGAVREQLKKASSMIPQAERPYVSVAVFATAGLRLLTQEKQKAIFEGLVEGLLAGPYDFDRKRLEGRTISGREEGVFALVAANYLAEKLHVSLETIGNDLKGVLDLGGSSTQVAAPPIIGEGELLPNKLGKEHTFVRSFLSLGMERMRQRTFERFVLLADATLREKGAVPNPCSFYGYKEPRESWRGTGDAATCEEAVRAVLKEEMARCVGARTEHCLTGDPVPLPGGPASSSKFYMISGYMYVTDFARWWLEQPGMLPDSMHEVFHKPGVFRTPTIAQLRTAASALCMAEWGELTSAALDPVRKHKFTGDHKVPHRCFELNYIVTLLSLGYGFGEHDRFFDFVEDIQGNEIEWTLGAFLVGRTSGKHFDPGEL